MTMPRFLNPDLIVAVLVAVFAALVLNTAYTFNWTSGLFPRLIGWIFLGLALIEVLVQVVALFKNRPRGDESGSMAPDTATVDVGSERPNVLKEFKGFLWLAGLLLSLYLVGFVISAPLYMFAFLRFSGRRSVAISTAIAAGVTAFVYVVFVYLLHYKLYPGILLVG